MREITAPLGPPGVCVVCECAPQMDAGVRVVDTERVLVSNFHHHLSGRKYVCSPCIVGMLQTLVPELDAAL